MRFSDLLKQRFKTEAVQQVQARPMTPDEAAWAKHKAWIDTVSLNYKAYFLGLNQKEPLILHEKKNATWKITSFVLPNQPFETFFDLYEHLEDETKDFTSWSAINGGTAYCIKVK